MPYKCGLWSRLSVSVSTIAALASGLSGSPGSTRCLHAQETTSLHGIVTDGSGHPVVGASAAIVNESARVLTDSVGSFVLLGLSPGIHRLRVERVGFEPFETEFTAAAGERVDLRVRLTPLPLTFSPLAVYGSGAEIQRVVERMSRVPGAVAYVGRLEMEDTRQANLKDVLRLVPGVFVQPKFGAADKSQLSIRGSGLRSSFELQGINMLVNGMPVRSADGFTDLESLELLSMEGIEVYKAGNAFRYGGNTLGGAINLRTKTGHGARPLQGFLEGGSYGFLKGQLSTGASFSRFDYYASYAHSELEGYRQFNRNERDRGGVHVGWAISPRVDLRATYLVARVDEQRPGSLTREEFEADPRQASPGALLLGTGREYTMHHVGFGLRSRIGQAGMFEALPWVQVRDLRVQIPWIVEQASRDFGADVRVELPVAGSHRLPLGMQGAVGRTENRYFVNEDGAPGELARDQVDRAASIAAYGEAAMGLGSRLDALLGLRYDWAYRALDDYFKADLDQSDDKWYQAMLPRIGVLYRPAKLDASVFANASRLFAPPLLLELDSPVEPGFLDLEATTGWQFEVGTRGKSGAIQWEASVFDLELRDEILNINLPLPGQPITIASFRNSPRTRHAGAEVGLSADLSSVIEANDALVASLSYTLMKATFVEDSTFEGNRMPGVPTQLLRLEATYRHPSGVAARQGVEWVPGDYYVDSENVHRNDGWLSLDFRIDWTVALTGIGLFVEARNLTNALYSPAVNADNGRLRYYLPADGRSVYGGVHWRP